MTLFLIRYFAQLVRKSCLFHWWTWKMLNKRKTLSDFKSEKIESHKTKHSEKMKLTRRQKNKRFSFHYCTLHKKASALRRARSNKLVGMSVDRIQIAVLTELYRALPPDPFRKSPLPFNESFIPICICMRGARAAPPRHFLLFFRPRKKSGPRHMTRLLSFSH